MMSTLSLSLICSKFYQLFLPALSKTSPIIYILFSYHYLLFPYVFFFCINVSGTYWYLEKQELDMYQFCCRYIVQVLVIQVKWSITSLLRFLKLTHLSCHCLSLILVSNRYWLFFHYAFECPVILKLCLWVSYNSQNYPCQMSHL